MRSVRAIQRDLMRVLVRAIFALFLIPGIVWTFTHHVLAERDGMFLSAVEAKVAHDAAPAAAQGEILAFYRTHLPSTACSPMSKVPAEYRDNFCQSWSSQWQMYCADRAAKVTIAAGLLLLLTVSVLGLVAFGSRAAQYGSLVLGWRILAFSSAAQVIVQSAMAVFLSFWLTAHFAERSFIKLIVVVAIVAGIAAFAAVAQIFARSPHDMEIEGELVPEGDAPELWKRIRALAGHLGTAPPEQLVAGIDANFFVTEAPLTVQGQPVGGRTLYVSLSLLRVLDKSEADAVLVHELAHLKGGDTSSSARLGPKLVQFDAYCNAMSGAGLTLVAFFLPSMYRFIFELALKRDSREREFKADRAAAGGRRLATGARADQGGSLQHLSKSGRAGTVRAPGKARRVNWHCCLRSPRPAAVCDVK